MSARSTATSVSPAGPAQPSRGLAKLDELVAASEQRQQARRAADNDELSRIAAALHRLERSGGISAAELLDQMTQTLGSTPTGDPSSLLTDDQEAVLREAGSFVDEMPPFMARASTATAMQGLSVVVSSLTTAQVATMLELTAGRIRQRATDRTLLSLRVASTLRFPLFQFPDRAEVPGWERVAPSFPANAHPVAIATFMDQRSDELIVGEQAVTPMEWLGGGGDPQAVVRLVEAAFKVRT